MRIFIALANVSSPDYTRIRSQYAPHFAALSDDAKRALNSYASSEAWAYNEHLRAHRGKMSPSFQYAHMHEPLDLALSCKLAQSAHTWRADRDFLGKAAVGSTVVALHPISTTVDVRAALDFARHDVKYLVNITLAKGVNFGVPQFEFEGEILLRQGTKFRIDGRNEHESNGVKYVVTDVLATPGKDQT